MKKICFVTTVSITLDTFVTKLAQYLYEYGKFDVTFVCSPDEKFQNSLPQYIHFIPVAMKRGISLDGIHVITELTKIFTNGQFDIVQYSTPNASCYASIAAKRAGIPVRLYCQWGIAYVGFNGIKRKLFKSIEKMVCKNSTVIEPDSYGNLYFSQTEKLYDINKGHVIWNGSASGVDVSKFDISKKECWRAQTRREWSIPEDAFVFGFVGRITGDKGINELFSAFKSAFEDNSNVYLMMVGSTEKSTTVRKELIEWSENHQNVIYCGFTAEAEKYYSAMDVFVLPSYREGFGSVVIEAEAMGVPVIVTDIPGPTDAMLTGETGVVIKKADVDSLKNAMRFFYINYPINMQENAYKFAIGSFNQRTLFSKILDDRVQLLSK